MAKRIKFELKEVIDLPTYDIKVNQMRTHVKGLQASVDGANELWETLKIGLQSAVTEIFGDQITVSKVESDKVSLIIDKKIEMDIEFKDDDGTSQHTIHIGSIKSWEKILLTEESYKLIGKLHNFAPELVQRVKRSKRKLDKVTAKKQEVERKIASYIQNEVAEYNENFYHLQWKELIDNSDKKLTVYKKSGRDTVYVKDGMVHAIPSYSYRRNNIRKPVKLDVYLRRFFDKKWKFETSWNGEYRELDTNDYIYRR